MTMWPTVSRAEDFGTVMILGDSITQANGDRGADGGYSYAFKCNQSGSSG